MNEAFVTKAIENDRYLKATRLKKQFEYEALRELKNAGRKVVEENRQLFVQHVSPETKKIPYSSSALATLRADFRMNRVRSTDSPKILRFNLTLEWIEPEEQGETEPANGALCYISYKIKDLSREEFEAVKQKTSAEDEWEIRFGEDVYSNAPGIFYIPVRSGSDMIDAFRKLRDHFSRFGDEFGVRMD